MIKLKDNFGREEIFTVHKKMTPKFKRELIKFDRYWDNKIEAIRGISMVLYRLDIADIRSYWDFEAAALKAKEQRDRELTKLYCVNKQTWRNGFWHQKNNADQEKENKRYERKLKSRIKYYGDTCGQASN